MILIIFFIIFSGCGGTKVIPDAFDAEIEVTETTNEIDIPETHEPDYNTDDNQIEAVCGDGRLWPPERCDDGNTESGDGCSYDCSKIEEGWACPTPGQPCVPTAICGDRRIGGREMCDDGNTESGDGCSGDCLQVEPGWICPIPGAACQAARCGDGIIAGFEECEDDDVVPESGDGCDAQCHLEEGFVCPTAGQACRETVCGDGIVEGLEQCEDRNNDLGDGCDPFCHKEPRCENGNCEGVCGDGVRLPSEECDDGNTRDYDGCSSSCRVEIGFQCTDEFETEPDSISIPIIYRDFMGRDLPDGHPDFEYVTGDDRGIVANNLGSDGKPVYASSGTTPTTNGRTYFDQWYRDTAGVNMTIVETLTLNRTDPGTFVFDSSSFFPLDGRGWVGAGREPARTGGHNFHFTSEVRYWFQYQGGEELSFRGDDDVWVFFNGILAIDIGGVHPAESASITLDATQASRLGLRIGGIYEAAVFQAERHTVASSYRLTLRGFNAPRSHCNYICGDGIVTRYEVCDDGKNDGSYGSCSPDCLAFGPYCGDGTLQTEFGEECDDGNTLPHDGCDAYCKREGPG